MCSSIPGEQLKRKKNLLFILAFRKEVRHCALKPFEEETMDFGKRRSRNIVVSEGPTLQFKGMRVEFDGNGLQCL